MGFLDRFSPQLLSALRIVSALLFIAHGTTKLLGFPATEMFAVAPEPMTLMWFGGILEAGGGALLLLGLFTRPVAFVLSGMMAVAYWMFHAPASFYPVQNGGDAAILYCFVFLYIAAAGGGPLSVDAMIGKKK
ncbi:DoxX family protein [Candidatus Viadribacter manganicus]|uniref:DoxX family protein n=1 Tax=Candidatus Viadribacter manganicus TaxID=1759059 RepID=A0A1B1AF63_9PROT|nr:DoxX family protein [Candidatus Viadribacter manganicus]ANP45171.1 DoxX family protein [Candidatus Viadribacter manganicus]